MANEKIIINDDLRTMQIPSSIVLLGVESDDDVNRIPFQMPKEYCGFDLSTFEARINYMNANGDGDIYIVDDLSADGDNSSLMNFSWLVGRNACAYKGNTKFIVCLKKFDEDQNVVQEFNTTVYSLPVLEGLETTEAVVQQNPDIIEYMLKLIEDAGIIDLQNYYTKDQVDAMKLPNPFPITINGVTYDGSEQVEMTIEGGASTKTETASGTIIHVEDAVPNEAVKSMKLYMANGTEYNQAAQIAITNKNLFRIDLLAQQTVAKGITFEKQSDGSIHAFGTSTGTYASAQCSIDKNAFLVGEIYTISSGKKTGSLYVQLTLNYADGSTDYLVSSNTPYTFTLEKEVASALASVQITASGLTIDETIYPMIELSDVATAFVNNIYNAVEFDGLTMPVLPASISNIWCNNDDVNNIVIEYLNDPLLARVNELAIEIESIQNQQHDSTIDAESENSVQNKAIANALALKMDNPSGGTSGQVLTKTDEGQEWRSNSVSTDSVLSDTSTNALQNKVIAQHLNNKVDKASGKGLSTNDYTTAEKNKLAGIAEGANKTTVDSAMSSSSTNPVQNKVVNSALAAKAPTASPTFTGTPKAPTPSAGTNTTQIATTAYVKQEIMNMVYPVGSIYMSVNSTSPATFFGGTWERIQDKFILAAGSSYSAGATGGAATHNHSYRVDYLGFHGEVVNKGSDGGGLTAYDYSKNAQAAATANGTLSDQWVNSALNGGEKEGTVNKFYSEGKTSSGSNLPPYLAVYVWKRTK